MKKVQSTCFGIDAHTWIGKEGEVRLSYSPPVRIDDGNKMTYLEAYNLLYCYLIRQRAK